MLVVPSAVIAAYPDPGEPMGDDREPVVLKSGRGEGRPWRRKPRLQVRLPPGLDIPLIRKALALALAFDAGSMALTVADPSGPVLGGPPPPPPPPPEPEPEPAPPPPPAPPPVTEDPQFIDLKDENQRLLATVNALLFEPLPGGITTRSEALHVLGFPPGAFPDTRTVRARFRMLATIHHPDSAVGSHERMSQLNAAVDFLRR